MKHLSDDELVDALDGELPPDRQMHLNGCEECGRKHADLLQTFTTAAVTPVPEPSPLFWDHMAARVSETIRDGPAEPAPSRWAGFMRTWWRHWASAAALSVFLLALAFMSSLTGPAPPSGSSATGPEVASAMLVDDLDEDLEWAIVRAAAADLGWEETHAAGIVPRPGAAERLIQELTAEERAELARLLDEELKRSGA